MAEYDHDIEGSDGCEEADLSMFAAVISSMHLDNLPTLATKLRNCQFHDQISPKKHECSIASPPLYGSYHILHVILFEDGKRWLLKVPATGYSPRHDRLCASSLMSEAMTMRLLKSKTTIPIPEVFLFDSSLDNALNCPNILMEYIDAIPLQKVWFDTGCPENILQVRRTQALEEVAFAMVQLGAFTYSQGGSLLFADNEGDHIIGSSRRLNMQAMLDRLETNKSDETAIFYEIGPSQTPKAYFQSLLATRISAVDNYGIGLHHLLQLFIDWVPCDTHYEPDFVLAHPDFDIQNVLVTPEGNLRSLIDWDGVYCYELEQVNILENSPKELEKYRALYRGFIEKAIFATKKSEVIRSERQLVIDPTTITQNSLVIGNLEIAMTDPVSMPSIMGKIFDELKEHVLGQSQGGENDDFYLYEIAIALGDEELDTDRLRMLQTGFKALFL